MNIPKKIAMLIVVPILLVNIAHNANAVGSSSWFIKHSGHKRPEIPAAAEYITEYNGYYADLKLNEDSKTKKLYLTFDAGYENGNIEKTLDVLRDKNVKAAFFVLDNLICKNTELVQRMADEGHLVCNHTKRHRDLTKCSREEIKEDLEALERLYTEKTGREMSSYFRFPEGKYSKEALECVDSLGYKTIFWSFAYADWDNNRQPSENFAKNKILSNTHNGAVILLHPTSSTNAAIISSLIDEWRAMGYEFGTLDVLTCK